MLKNRQGSISTLCRLCRSKDLAPHLNIGNERLDLCHNCGFIQVQREPSEDDLREIYSDAYFMHTKYRDTRALDLENTRRLYMLKEMLPSSAKVLDAGCATGDFISVAKKHFQVYGIDIAESAIARARLANPEIADRLQAGRLENSSYSEAYFDAVCLWDVIEHLWDPVPVVSSLMTSLKPGGFLLISTPAIDSHVARYLGPYWAFMTPPEHLGFFTEKSFGVLFNNHVPGKIIKLIRRGKWANLAFIAYKLRRVLPRWAPQWILAPLYWPYIRRVNIYVPTADVQYLIVRKPE